MYDKLIANSRNDNTHSAFRLFDKAGSGQITIDALKETYTEYDFIIDDSTAQTIFEHYDTDQDGRITMNDFASYMHDPKNFEHKNYQKYDPKQFWEVSQERKKKLGDNYGGPPVKADLPPSLAYCSWTETVLIDKIRDKIQMKTVDDGRGQHNSFRLFDVHGQGIIKRNTLQTRLEEVGYLWVYLCPLCRAMSSARRLCSLAAAAAAAAAAAPPANFTHASGF